MRCVSKVVLMFLLVVTVSLGLGNFAYAQEAKKKELSGTPVLWRDPGDVASLDLRYGPGAAHLAPVPPYTFIEEDKGGESPKFEVRDARGVKWVVKLGEEAQTETVATRLVWAAGYFAEESYYFDSIRVRQMKKLSRGEEFIDRRGVIHGVRFEPRRAGVARGDTWDWRKNHFEGTQELSGLKILMILLNNYDARAENNTILYVTDPSGRPEALHYVTDLGATLGKADGMGGKRTKNNLEDFRSTRFVLGVDDDGSVKFDYDTRPTKFGMLSVIYPPYYRSEVKKEKAMRGIPVEHARWIGAILGQLTDNQLRQALNAARYEPELTEGYVRELRARINQLTRL